MEYAGWRSVASGGNYALNKHNFIQKQLVTLTFLIRAISIKLCVFILIAMTNKTFSFDWSYISVCKTLVTKDIHLWKAQRNHNFCLWEGTGTAGTVIVYNLRTYVYVSALLTFFCIWVCASLSMSIGLSLSVDCLWPALSLCALPRGKVLDRSLHTEPLTQPVAFWPWLFQAPVRLHQPQREHTAS